MSTPERFVYAEAGRLGLTRGNLRTSLFDSPAHSVYAASCTSRDLRGACATLLLALPADAVFSHVTAAGLRGWWLPHQLLDGLIIACTDGNAPHHNRRGVYVRRCRTSATDRASVAGLPVTSAERTLAELAEDFSLLDLVCTMDSALRSGTCTVESLTAAAPRRRRGSARFAEAVGLADGRAESRWESVLRLLYTWSGVRVEPQYAVHDEVGTFLARADMRVVGTRRLVEYDGADHRDAGQHARDLGREKSLLRDGWERYGYTATEIHRTPEQIVADACAASGLPFRSRSMTHWNREYRLSTLTPAGRARLDDRMRRFQRELSPRRDRKRIS